MDINKLTSQFQQDLGAAQSIAIAKNNSVIEPIHVLKTMSENGESSVRNLLSQTGVDLAKLKLQFDQAIDGLAKVTSPNGDINISQNLLRLLNQVDKLANDKNDSYLSTELFLLAVIQSNDR